MTTVWYWLIVGATLKQKASSLLSSFNVKVTPVSDAPVCQGRTLHPGTQLARPAISKSTTMYRSLSILHVHDSSVSLGHLVSWLFTVMSLCHRAIQIDTAVPSCCRYSGLQSGWPACEGETFQNAKLFLIRHHRNPILQLQVHHRNSVDREWSTREACPPCMQSSGL